MRESLRHGGKRSLCSTDGGTLPGGFLSGETERGGVLEDDERRDRGGQVVSLLYKSCF